MALVVFTKSREARAGINLNSSFYDNWFSQHFISNLATGRAEGNGAQKGEVMEGAGESGRGRASK